ncbi:MAG: translation elongation factor 4 [Candidatus Nealsonbacteria bacterium]|nr:translation elongation factor 4 [Candidatus Nealsonbacteria bacterium]
MERRQIRNFCIISHIDHGKSTLADRLLEITKTIAPGKMKPQYLDMMELEREKGITIKMQPVRMEYEHKGQKYILNLIDTPGHVDFSYEVSRSLEAVEGAILLVDASKGIQAQTLANLDLVKKQNLVIIPAVNKIDMAQAETEKTIEELANLLEIDKKDILRISGKLGTNVDKILDSVISKVPSPGINNEAPFRALIFDSVYDPYKGVIAFVRVIDGRIKNGAKIRLLAAKAKSEAREIGYFKPQLVKQDELLSGEIGYIATGIKEPGLVRTGDTIAIDDGLKVEPLPGYKEVSPMVFASFYPENPDDFAVLKDALGKLKLTDPALIYEQETKEALGRGFRCGFLGTLHTEIISERLSREFNLELVISTPSVVYKVIDSKGNEELIYSATDWPDQSNIKESQEPWVDLEIITPVEFIGAISEILKGLRTSYIDTKYISFNRAILIYEAPLAEIITNFYDKLKGVSKGYASMNYKVIGYRKSNLVKMEILIAGVKEEAFSKIVPNEKSFQEGKNLVVKLKENLPSQQFSVALQAVVGGKIIARETMKSRMKDVTGYLYGGDYSRKRKLLEKQKKGKKLLKEKGVVRVPTKVFLEVFRG